MWVWQTRLQQQWWLLLPGQHVATSSNEEDQFYVTDGTKKPITKIISKSAN
jgi:hypothetical protein